MWSGRTTRVSTGSLTRPAGVAPLRARPLRTSTLSRAPVKATSQQPATSGGFFNREYELADLQELRMSRPSEIQLILGPRSCGKTALLAELLKDKRNAVLINCRRIDATTPAAFFAALLKQLGQAVPKQVGIEALLRMLAANLPLAAQLFFQGTGIRFKDIEAEAASRTDVTFDFKKLVAGFKDIIDKEPGQLDDANGAIQAFETVLAVWEKHPGDGLAEPGPILVIDEVNRLTQWKDSSPETLDTLLAYFVNISKEESRCHVVLATSEYAFEEWLRAEVGDGFFDVLVVGDFSEADARLFFEEQLQQQQVAITLDDDAWHMVYEVCGGNAGFLVRMVGRLKRRLKRRFEPLACLDWRIELDALAMPVGHRIDDMLAGEEGQDWTPGQLAAAALELLRTPGHAVPEQTMNILLGRLALGPGASRTAQRAAGKKVLRSLVKANALAVRPFSAWAQDIPASAFKGTLAVVTAPSTLHLYCMRSREKDLTELQEEEEEFRKRKTGGAGVD